MTSWWQLSAAIGTAWGALCILALAAICLASKGEDE